eukprot:6276521-Heterocapsa_arctica.AAC.1
MPPRKPDVSLPTVAGSFPPSRLGSEPPPPFYFGDLTAAGLGAPAYIDLGGCTSSGRVLRYIPWIECTKRDQELQG